MDLHGRCRKIYIYIYICAGGFYKPTHITNIYIYILYIINYNYISGEHQANDTALVAGQHFVDENKRAVL